MKRSINPAGIPFSPFYAQGVHVSAPGSMVFVSGQVGVSADSEPAGDIGGQTRQAIANVHAVLDEAGVGPGDIVKQTIYLTSPDLVPGFVEAAAETLGEDPPATTMLIVSGLADPRLLVEIEAIAVVAPGPA